MKLLIDMNLSPQWCGAPQGHGHTAVHWWDVSDPRAPDEDRLARPGR